MAAGRHQTRTKHITREDLARAGIEIRKAVAAGMISAEQGRAKMEMMRRMMGPQSERGAGKGATRRRTREDQQPRQGGGAICREERLRIWRSMSEEERTKLHEEALRRMSGERR